MPFLFAAAIALNAFLLFAVEPMVARMILPLLGGTPQVWNTCMVFFQAALLAGYAAAHAITTRRGVVFQSRVYPWLLIIVFLVLPIQLREGAWASVPQESNPIPWVLGTLLVLVGLPFFAVATTGTVLQKWFSQTDYQGARDPYFLYAVSNFGSMFALLGYPVLLEPHFRLPDQSWLWAGGFWLLALLTLACAWSVGRRACTGASCLTPHAPRPTLSNDPYPVTPISAARRLRWVALAFAPSSLMLGVTTYLSTDIATIPLLWIIPLALYLLTFILVFARKRLIPHWIVARILPMVIIVLTVLLLAEDLQPPIVLSIGLHLATFFIAAMFCHGELANDRPSALYLTEFYLWLAFGGVLGGLFNALVAPLIFPRILEYPLTLLMICLLRSNTMKREACSAEREATPHASRLTLHAPRPTPDALDWILPLGLGGLTLALVLGSSHWGFKSNRISVGIMFGLPAVLCYALESRPLRFALGIGAIMLASLFYSSGQGMALQTERSFFGVLRVTLDPTGKFHQLVHGNTIHGRHSKQDLDSDGRHQPLSYYHRTGPIGQVFDRIRTRFPHARVGVVGLGVGSLAWYARPGENWTYYEIDPAVKRIAYNERYFTFLRDCRADELNVVLGDARLRLREAPDGFYDMLILDAFSSDAVPVHLLTREALQMYLAKLAPDGILAFHISNRYLNLKPVLGNLADDAQIVGICRDDLSVTKEEAEQGKDPSQWALLAQSKTAFGPLAKSIFWEALPKEPRIGVWTDDFSNILSIFKWFEWEKD